MIPVRLFNTLTRRKEEFAPLKAPQVGLYTCGPTVYNFQHIGNYRTYIFEDLLKRSLSFLGYVVRHVMNITDVGHLTSQADEGEDKMEVGARREGKTAWEIAEFYTRSFFEDTERLGLLKPDVVCRATDHIPEMMRLIEALEAKGYIYRTDDGVYYDTSRFEGYGKLARGGLKGQKAGARVESNPQKRHPQDFALWKFSPKGQKRHMEWDSPWGCGFPGWHIECSAMSMKYLGDSFDIHCGGVDHIPIHHTNEIAQSEGASGKSFVRVWMHGEFLLSNSAKMAKSAGEFLKLSALTERGFDPLAYRYLCLTTHYRKQLDFSFEALGAAAKALERLRDRARALRQQAGGLKTAADGPAGPLKAFQERLADDLDVPGALALLWESLKAGTLNPQAQLGFLREADRVLGLGTAEAEMEDRPLPAKARALLDEREEARRKKDFKKADALRKELSGMGISVEDTPSGPRWK